MYCANRKLLLVCTDRKSRYTCITKLDNYTIKHATQRTSEILQGKPVHTLTNDNGPEFRDGPNMKVPVYFCDPMKPHQRGTVENTIGLLRQYIKRSTSHQALGQRRLKTIEDRLNHRPRRCLDYRTPYEVFYGKTVALVT
jgi:IS30 family transposase